VEINTHEAMWMSGHVRRARIVRLVQLVDQLATYLTLNVAALMNYG
jgi:hypothetical protein